MKLLKTICALAACSMMTIGVHASTVGTIQFTTSGNSGFGKIFDVGGITALSGTGFSAQLWGGTVNNESSFTFLGAPETFATGAAAGFVGVGSPFSAAGQTYNVTGTIGGQTVFYEVRAWNNGGGSITTFAAATIKAISGISSAQLGGSDNSGNPPFISPLANGFSNFSLVASVPEPSVLALGVMGGMVLLFRRRR